MINSPPSWMLKTSVGTDMTTNPPPNPENNIVTSMRHTPKGQRNHQLNKLAFEIGTQEKRLGIQQPVVLENLKSAALASGLDLKEIESTISQGRIAGFNTTNNRSTSRGSRPNNELTLSAPPVKASKFIAIDPINIPKREWLFGNHYIRKFVSVTIAPGGVGKSALTLTEAVFMASGRKFEVFPGHEEIKRKRLKVWIYNLEDPQDELNRRIAGICNYYDIRQKDLEGYLFLDSGRDQPLTIASMKRNASKVESICSESILNELGKNSIDVMIVDPYISSHQVNENDNMANDLVMKTWNKIADSANASVCLVHHTRKAAEGIPTSAESSRGAKSITDAAREVRVLSQMTEHEATRFEQANHKSCFWASSDKHNLAPAPNDKDWYKLQTVDLPNGDSVGVPIRIYPSPIEINLSEQEISKIKRLIENSEYREDAQSPEWIGERIATALDIEFGNCKKQSERSSVEKHGLAKLKRIVTYLLNRNILSQIEKTVRGSPKKFLRLS